MIMTSNAGAENIIAPRHLGFTSQDDEKARYTRMKTGVMDEVKRLFKPEFLNRIDEIIVFHPLNKTHMKEKMCIRDRIMMPYHILFDTYEEARLAGRSFGSTKSGIAPFYSDKYAKIGFQVCELFGDETALMEKLENVCALKNVLLEHLYHKPLLDPKELFDTMMEYKEMIAPYVCDVSRYLHDALKEGKNILLEGQLGSLKDPDHGIYPMVTSSSTDVYKRQPRIPAVSGIRRTMRS